jgi:hypothetical protein
MQTTATTPRTNASAPLVTALYLPFPMAFIGSMVFLQLLLSDHSTAVALSGLCTLVGMIAAPPFALVALFLGWTRRRAVFWGAVVANSLVIAFDVLILYAIYADSR